jgi:hypothetical protein
VWRLLIKSNINGWLSWATFIAAQLALLILVGAMTMPLYDENNPHPGFGKDPNIRNVQGHTDYPKFVTNKDGERVIVNNPTEEEEIAVIEEVIAAPKGKQKAGWPTAAKKPE